MHRFLHPPGLRGVFLKAQLALEAEISTLLLCMCIAAFLFAAISALPRANAARTQIHSAFILSDASEFADAFSLLPKPSYTSFNPTPNPPARLSAPANSTHSKTIAKIFGYEVQPIEKEPI